jgi:glycosyltransferase involved in cell wall biosynthesis
VVVKVAFVTGDYPPEGRGGTEQVVTALARELRARGVEIAAITCSTAVHSGLDLRDDEYEGVPVRRLWKHHGEWDHDGFVRPRVLGLVRDWLQNVRPDVVHVHSFAALGAGTLAVCRDLGMPALLSFHDLWVTCARYFRLPPEGIVCPTGTDRTACVPCIDQVVRGGPQQVAAALAARDAAVRADVALAAVTVAPSATTARFVRECLPYAGRIEVVPHGLLRAVPAADRAVRHRPGEPLRVGTFGNLVAEKGVYELVRAMAGLPAELHLYGGWLQADFRDRMRALAAGNGVALVEHGPYQATVDHPAKHLHLAVFPSRCQETYGLVVDEALAHGVPAVLSDRGAFAERRGRPGVVVTPLDGLAATLRELVGDPARLAALADAVPHDLPTIAASAVRHLDLYREIA